MSFERTIGRLLRSIQAGERHLAWNDPRLRAIPASISLRSSAFADGAPMPRPLRRRWRRRQHLAAAELVGYSSWSGGTGAHHAGPGCAPASPGHASNRGYPAGPGWCRRRSALARQRSRNQLWPRLVSQDRLCRPASCVWSRSASLRVPDLRIEAAADGYDGSGSWFDGLRHRKVRMRPRPFNRDLRAALKISSVRCRRRHQPCGALPRFQC